MAFDTRSGKNGACSHTRAARRGTESPGMAGSGYASVCDVRNGDCRARTSPSKWSCGTPPRGFEENDARGDRYIEAFDLAAHRDAHQQVAALARQAPHAFPLGTQHPGNRFGNVALVKCFLGALVGADDPDVSLFQLRKRAREIC